MRSLPSWALKMKRPRMDGPSTLDLGPTYKKHHVIRLLVLYY